MKRTILFIIAIVVVLSCTKGVQPQQPVRDIAASQPENASQESDATEPAEPSLEPAEPVEDVYYIKYASDNTGKYNVSYMKADGTSWSGQNIYLSGTFERTVGPVKKGFNARLSISSGNYAASEIFGRIELKVNDEPFVVKVEGRAETGLSYTVQ